MLLAQSTPIATPSPVAVHVDHFIIGDLSKVVANRDEGSVIEQNVRRHQYWIEEQASVD